jgi:hypothetical protein
MKQKLWSCEQCHKEINIKEDAHVVIPTKCGPIYNCGCYFDLIVLQEKFASYNGATFFRLMGIHRGVYEWRCTHGGWTILCDKTGKILDSEVVKLGHLKNFKLDKYYDNMEDFQRAYAKITLGDQNEK